MINIKQCSIKKKRILKIFIESATQILKDQGLEAVTIRKVADVAGYNSATIYNYFDNINKLISFAAMGIINESYIKALPDYLDESNSCLDNFLAIWRCFCEHCFQNPKIYYAVFTEDIGKKPNNLIRNYYFLFPEELDNYPSRLLPMIMESDFAKRCEITIKPCVTAGHFTEEEAKQINEMVRLLYQGMLSLLINNRIDYSAEEATEKIMTYIKELI